MNLAKGHLKQLSLMKVHPGEFSDEAIQRFLAFTDRGENIFFICQGTPLKGYFYPPQGLNLELAELYERFQWLGMREKEWAAGFKEGTLTPWDFVLDYNSNDFETAKRIDTKVYGFERKAWTYLRGC